MKINKTAFLLLASILLLSACGKKEAAEEPTVTETPVTVTEEPVVPMEPPLPPATEDFSAVKDSDVLRAEIKKAEIDKNRHLIVTTADKKEQDQGYVGGDENTKGYTVSFLDYDGSPVKVETVEKGGSATPPNPPLHSDLDFLRWEGSWENITKDSVITASYTRRGIYYTLRYCDEAGNLLHTEKIAAGTAPKGYEAPAKTGYIFAFWENYPLQLTGDTEVKAHYVPETSFAFALSSATVKAGETAELTLSVKNCPGLIGLALALETSEAVTLDSFVFDEVIGGTGTGPDRLPRSGELKFNWFNINGELSGDRVLLRLRCSVAQDAPEGEYWLALKLKDSELVNQEETELTAEPIFGRITVTAQ